MADTGAREPQRLVDALTWIADPSYVGNYSDSEVIEIHRKWARHALALAAGVGVPPDEDSVSAPAKERQDAREQLLHLYAAVEEFLLSEHEHEADEIAVRNRLNRAMAATKEALVGVGEARPADPPTEGMWERRCNEAYERFDAASNEALQANLRAARLREQLDALADLAKRARNAAAAPDYDEEAIRDALWALARAALGVVGPPPDEVSALGQKASETRGGDS